MKKLNKIIYTTLLSALVFSSCDSKLDVEPKQQISSSVALSTPADINNALVGAYTVIARGSLYGTNLVMVPEIYASTNNVNWVGTFSTYRDISNQNIITTNEDVRRTWVDAYKAINVANTVLASLNILTDADQKSEVEGRALFIRAIMHFELVRLYALPFEAGTANSQLGVPLSLKAVQNLDEVDPTVKRNTVAEVYTSVIADLNSAITKLQNSDAHQFAAKGMLARVYLQQGDFTKARDLANDVISNGGFDLESNLETPFRVKNSSEGVFEIQQSEQSNAGSSNDGLATFFSSYENATGGNVGRGDVNINNVLFNSYEATDKRRTEMIYVGTGSRKGPNFTKKWYNYFDNIPVVRLTELYLTRAESNFRLTTTVGATPVSDINKLRARAGVSAYSTLTLNDILEERQKELAFEGYRLHDYKRTKRSIGTLPYNSPKLVFPIPYREITVNKNLEQNPGYN